MTLKVYEVVPATGGGAEWLCRILRPVTLAARFERPPPLELLPCGRFVGWSQPRDMAPDGRMSLPSRIAFSSPRGIIDSYLHDVGRCITWSIQQAEELASTDLSAEAMAAEIVRRYEVWLAELQDRPRLARIKVRMARGWEASIDRLKDRLFVSTLVASVSTLMLVLIVLMRVLR